MMEVSLRESFTPVEQIKQQRVIAGGETKKSLGIGCHYRPHSVEIGTAHKRSPIGMVSKPS